MSLPAISELIPALKLPGLRLVAPIVSKLICLDWLNNNVILPIQHKYPGDPRALIDKFSEATEIKVDHRQEQLQHIPKTGPCIIIANHPTDLLDHATITTALSKIRRDYKFTANNAVEKLKLWDDVIFSLQLAKEKNALAHNTNSIRNCIKWLESGHVLITYPGAKPSKLSQKVRKGRTVWSTLPFLLSSKTGAPIVPAKITLKEPAHHKFLKQYFRPAYDLLIFRVVKRFSNKTVKVSFGKAIKTKYSTSNKTLLGKKLEESVCSLC